MIKILPGKVKEKHICASSVISLIFIMVYIKAST